MAEEVLTRCVCRASARLGTGWETVLKLKLGSWGHAGDEAGGLASRVSGSNKRRQQVGTLRDPAVRPGPTRGPGDETQEGRVPGLGGPTGW